jgi:hypothetical protein
VAETLPGDVDVLRPVEPDPGAEVVAVEFEKPVGPTAVEVELRDRVKGTGVMVGKLVGITAVVVVSAAKASWAARRARAAVENCMVAVWRIG